MSQERNSDGFLPSPDYASPIRPTNRQSQDPDNLDPPQNPPKAKMYNNLDLIKADTPPTVTKISRMLHQLEFKLQVEREYKKGIDKMAKLYQADGDKRSRADAESKRVESDKKIQLLQASLKRYKNLHILDADPDEEDDDTPTGIFFVHASLTCSLNSAESR
jgi:hypothetical protein